MGLVWHSMHICFSIFHNKFLYKHKLFKKKVLRISCCLFISNSTSDTPTTQPSQPVAGSSTTDANNADSGVPEGLDPSFLAALPENIRAEVIADHLRMQRIQQRSREQQQNQTAGGMEVNPEFLAALPPNIQEEVSPLFTSTEYRWLTSCDE